MADTLRDLVIRLGFDVNTSTLPQIDRQLAGVTNQAGKMDKALGGAFARFAGPAALAAGGFKGLSMVKDTLVEAGDAAVEFGRDMGAIQTFAGKDPGRVNELRKNIQDLSVATGKSSKEIAAAVNDVLQAFDDTGDTMKLAEIATRGATASGTDARTAFDLLSTTMLQFGKSGAGAAKETMDMAFAMRQFGKVEIAQMAHGLGEVASSMKEIGGTEKELFAIIGTTAGITGPVDQVFTQLGSVITALKTPTKELQKVYKDLGITSIESAVQQDGLFGVMQKIQRASGGSIEAFAKLVPDVRAGRLFTPLTTTLAGRYAEAVKRVATSTGAAAEADKLFRGGLNKTGTELDQLDKKYQTISENMGTRLAPVQLAFKKFSVSAIGSLSDVEGALEELVSGKNKNPGEVTPMGVGQTVVQGVGFLGNVAGGLATDLLPEFLGGGRGFTSGAENTLRQAQALVHRMNGDSELQAGGGARGRSRGGDAPLALSTGERAYREVSNQITQTNTINLTLPEGADAEAFASAFDRAAQRNADALARDVRTAASGDSP